jgi:hypothetical protein
VAAHQRQALEQRDGPDPYSGDVRLLDHQASARNTHAQQLPKAGLLVLEVVVRVDDDHPLEAAVGEGQPLGIRRREPQPRLGAGLAQHVQRPVCHDHAVDQRDKR